MADLIVPTPTDEPAVDPIMEAQCAVMEAKALLQCIDSAVQGINDVYSNVDLLAALAGVIRLLDKVGDDLDPTTFRKAVLASMEVANG